ncbi:conserved Plasmodium protein, unknown function [Plasmodium gallinaceum]|uniref:Programmed cell death protein 2 C-terminal domain-containing protein n=1 Tax=Plasmodium gallinaceum TaxID=5849 RepID=A0A1J1H004_PLAGA|nr:conserved Plasmodium protein, unknown function [Plasmodium gallinaceum]CRG97881.1 conserved Plasmodium protein, unknown function [Plasmodium gallinaceum]
MYIGVLSDEIDDNFDLKNDSKFGGDPLWLCGKEPANIHLKCTICKKDLIFLFQLSTSYDEYIRIIYIFCCVNSTKCNMDKRNWVCIKAKKKLLDNSEYKKIEDKNGLNMHEVCSDKNIKINRYCSTSSKKIEDNGKTTFSFSGENTEKEDVFQEKIICRKEKLIDWNSLFSKSVKDEKSNIPLFNYSINKSLNYVNQKNENNHNINSNNINTYETYYDKSYDLINSKITFDNKKELNKCYKMNHENVNIIPSNDSKLPSYYIYLVEDDEEYDKDYLYEKAKKMYEMYEHNKHILEHEECNNEGNDDIDNNEESFENDFNGCIKFYSYLSKNYNQILRYSYKGKFLYMHKQTKNYLKGKNMLCAHCKSKLVFELQFFSTFIYQIEKKLQNKENNVLKNIINNFSVGNVIIFSCEMDCVSIDDIYSYEHIELEIF